MKDIVSSVVLRERKPRKRKYKKKQPRLSKKMVKTKELVKEGFSLAKAMEMAGYAPSTVKHNASLYLKRFDLDELKRGLKTDTALGSLKALRVLNQLMDNAEKDQDKIRAADAVLKAGKTHLAKDETPPKFTFILQTIQGQRVILNSPGKPDDLIDVEAETEEGK